MIRAQDIEHTWRDASAEVRCLKGLDLELEAGEFCCLRGVSGSATTAIPSNRHSITILPAVSGKTSGP